MVFFAFDEIEKEKSRIRMGSDSDWLSSGWDSPSLMIYLLMPQQTRIRQVAL
jgi:hypothetical protein